MADAFDADLRRIIYTSVAQSNDLINILRISRLNNGIDGISGLLVLDGRRFTQVLEGPPVSVTAAFERIQADARHCGIVVISDSIEHDRLFGGWAMAGMDGDEEAVLDGTRELLSKVPATIRDTLVQS